MRRVAVSVFAGITMLVIVPVMFFYLILRPWTEFSQGFSESAFEQVEIGDARSGVLERLGPPINETLLEYENQFLTRYGALAEYTPRNELREPPLRYMVYSTPKPFMGSETNFHVRTFVLNADTDTVVERVAYTFYD